MRVLRSTMYPPIGVGPSVTMSFRDRDVTVSLEEAIDRICSKSAELFTINDIFSMPENSAQQASVEANARAKARKQREESMTDLFYWCVSMIEKRKGVARNIENHRGAPLSRDEIVYVFEQLAKHPSYYPGVRIETHSTESGSSVVLNNGMVFVENVTEPAGNKGRFGPN